jgi:hypothetical protein
MCSLFSKTIKSLLVKTINNKFLIEPNGTKDPGIVQKKTHRITTVLPPLKQLRRFKSQNSSKVFSSIAKNLDNFYPNLRFKKNKLYLLCWEMS